ncbi:MAG: terminase family protein [Rhodospirillaceae bacterium]
MAGNQLGKTMAGGMEAAMHATGIYPPWWLGHRFNKATAGWAAGVSGEATRDTVQRVLLGRVGEWGTGALPESAIVRVTPARGAADLVDTVTVRHDSGGTSHIVFKSYEKGREKWQGETLDWVWFDEEPPVEIYTEGLTRTNATNGIVWLTFTPLLGLSPVVARFVMDDDATEDRHVTRMTLDDAPHFSDAQKARILSSYADYERDARARGQPKLGSGRVFAIDEDDIKEKAVDLPDHWPRLCGLDIGWDHPTAAVWMAWDRDTDTLHVYDAYRLRQQTPVVHAAAIKARGDWIPVAWPADALQHEKGSGKQIAEQYREQGVAMLPEAATFSDGSVSVEAGVFTLLDRMKTQRFKVAAHLSDWWEEFGLYHRKDGRIVKERDDLLCATRYALMMLRFAAELPATTVWSGVDTKWVV